MVRVRRLASISTAQKAACQARSQRKFNIFSGLQVIPPDNLGWVCMDVSAVTTSRSRSHDRCFSPSAGGPEFNNGAMVNVAPSRYGERGTHSLLLIVDPH